jgi:hypothetical protein
LTTIFKNNHENNSNLIRFGTYVIIDTASAQYGNNGYNNGGYGGGGYGRNNQ